MCVILKWCSSLVKLLKFCVTFSRWSVIIVKNNVLLIKLKGLKVANNADIFVTSAQWEFAWPNSDLPNIEARIEVR